MSFLTDFRVNEQKLNSDNTDDSELLRLYLRSMAVSLASIADELHEANNLKKAEIEQMKKRKI